MRLTTGRRLGPYEIEAALGTGGMGEVYRPRDTRLDRVVAIKVLPPGVADDPQRRERFEREARAISSLNHPHICTLYDVGHLTRQLRLDVHDHIRLVQGYAFSGELQSVVSRGTDVSRWIVAGGRRIPLSEGENPIGRDPASAVCLDATGVLRCHARIVVGRDRAMLEDLGSKNGTTLGDRPVKGKVALRDGDRIHVGPILVIYHTSASGMPTETIGHTARDG